MINGKTSLYGRHDLDMIMVGVVENSVNAKRVAKLVAKLVAKDVPVKDVELKIDKLNNINHQNHRIEYKKVYIRIKLT